jgi:hypothetical protein
MKTLFKFTVLLLFCNTWAQQQSSQWSENLEDNQQRIISKAAHSSDVYDLFAETLTDENGKVYYFQFSPIYQKRGYTTLLSKYDNVVFLQKMKKPLEAVWVLKNNSLYLQDFSCFRTGSDEAYLSQKAAMLTDLEPFFEAKKDTNGHIEATFLTGEMHLYTRKPNDVSNKAEQQYFVAHFKKGKLLKMEETDKDWNPKK